jgi:hypothetical protein
MPKTVINKRRVDDRPVDPQIMAALAQKLTIGACCVFAVSVFLSIISLRCLYADGSFQLTEVLKAGSFVELAKNRDCASFLFQFPVVLAIKLGVTNLHTLELAFGLGCFLPWPISLMFCRWLAPRQFWLVMLGCAIGYLNACFMPVGEYNIAHAFFWPVLFAILFARPLKPLAAGILLVSALILLFSYESLLFLGPPLSLLAAWRVIRGGERFLPRAVLGLAALLLMLSAAIALDGILCPQCPNNLGGFQRGMRAIFLQPTWPMIWSLLWLILAGVVCIGKKKFTTRAFRLEQALFAWVILIWALGPILHPADTGADRQYELRSLQLLVPFALMILAWVLSVRPQWFETQYSYFVGFSASLLLAQSLWLISATWQWHGFVGIWRGVLASHRGPVQLEDTPFAVPSLQGQALSFDWPWADPGLSILLTPECRVQSMILPRVQPPWQPFDPRNPKEFPNLQHYGLDYRDYIEAIQNSPAAANPLPPPRPLPE